MPQRDYLKVLRKPGTLCEFYAPNGTFPTRTLDRIWLKCSTYPTQSTNLKVN